MIARGKDNAPVYLRDVANVIDTRAGRASFASLFRARF